MRYSSIGNRLSFIGTNLSGNSGTPSAADPNLQIWYDASDNTTMNQPGAVPTVDGTFITKWANKGLVSAKDANTTGPTGNQPKYYNNIQNGKSCIYFDGTNDQFSVNPISLFSGSSATYIIGVKPSNKNNQTISILGSNNANFNELRFGISGSTWFIGNGGGTATTLNDVPDTNFHVISMLYDGTQTGNSNRLKMRVDGNDQTLYFNNSSSIATSMSAAPTYFYIGEDATGVGDYTGYIGEFVIYNKKLTSAEISLAENYLYTKWGTSASTASFTTNGLITNYTVQNGFSIAANSSTFIDLVSINNGNIKGAVSSSYTSGTPNYLTISGSTSNYIITSTNLNPSLSPANTGTNISIFLWVNPSSNGTILSEQGSTTPDSAWYDAQIEWKSGTPVFGVWPYTLGTPLITSSVSAALNSWHYVGFTYDGTTLRAYVNGVAAGTASVTRQTPYNNSSNKPLHYTIGYPTLTNLTNASATAAPSNFKFGAIQIYNRAITATEVLYNYQSKKGAYGL